MNDFKHAHEMLAASWKRETGTLPEAARATSPYILKDGTPVGDYPYCLPAEYADHNLLPEVRDGAITLFAELGIPWHAGVDSWPTNHLLSSQVQCVNALHQMVSDPDRIQRAFGGYVDIGEVLEIEPGRFMTFEYIGTDDLLSEARSGSRTRGSMCTSVDAAFRYRTPAGSIELALVEWKYTESYPRKIKPKPGHNTTRAARYAPLFHTHEGWIRTDLVDLEVLFDEPFYQLLRQQLLAQELERTRAEGADAVRLLHVLDPGNKAYQASLVSPELRALGTTVDDVWNQLNQRPDRFAHVDPAAFLDPTVTSAEYVARYYAAPA